MTQELLKELPECVLIKTLAERADERKDTTFAFLSKLNDFRERVSAEVQFINQLFPEYTPHNAKYHINKLFHVADKLLTQEKLGEMNSAELFVLACGLYGHDWGMAVSEKEKNYILSGQILAEAKIKELWILGDEQNRLEEFAKKHNIPKDPQKGYSAMPIELWAKYVRQTHAMRSAERAKRYFESLGEGIPEAVARVCKAHWLEFEDIRDEKHFPPDFSVLGENVNLRAIAVYVRLIDLLDMADDRTPYIIWKFVDPKDPTSKMEWNKHRALSPVTFPPYQQGRIIQVDGSTTDNDVYASLEDLRVYCEEQLKECKDTLAQMNDPHHALDIYHLSWRVAASGFIVPSIRFEFDRKKIFEILGDQIYRGNPHIFLRELLQNSIDAIRMRQAILARNNLECSGTIYATIDNKDNGDIEVIWTDDGIGMDEYIVRNFLAIAGKSYYSSTEFEEQGLTFDPISKFGIGILSCFLVADRIEIETKREPYFATSNCQPLKICIPDEEKHFRVEYGSPSLQVGTTVRVFIRAERLKELREKAPNEEFNPTEYLSRVAGFVEYPIVICEKGNTTIILHPDSDLPARLESLKNEDAVIRKLNLGFPIEEWALPQDLGIAEKYFEEKQIDISKDIKLSGYEGKISFIVPSSNEFEWNSTSSYNLSLFTPDSKQEEGGRVRLYERGDYFSNEHEDWLPSLSGKGLIFRDGILVSNLKYYWRSSRQRIVVNLKNLSKAEIDVSRSALVGKDKDWHETVRASLKKYFVETWVKDAQNTDLGRSLYLLARGCAIHEISPEEIWEVCSQDNWPMPFLGKYGELVVQNWKDLKQAKMPIIPEDLYRQYCHFMSESILWGRDYDGLFKFWTGELSLLACPSFHLYDLPDILRIYNDLWVPPLKNRHSRETHFIEAPWEGLPYLMQEILIPLSNVEKEVAIPTEILEIVAEDPGKISLEIIRELISVYESEYYREYHGIRGNSIYSCGWEKIERCRSFTHPYSHAFGYGWDATNFNHPTTRQLLILCANITLAKLEKRLSPPQWGFLCDAWKSFPTFEQSLLATKGRIARAQMAIDEVCNLLKQYGITKQFEGSIQLPSLDEFVPGTTTEMHDTIVEGRLKVTYSNREFGQPIIG